MSQVTIEPRRSACSSALETNHVVKASAGRVFGLVVQLGDGTGGADTMPSATYWLLLVDARTVPSAGAVTPLAALAVDHTAGTRDLVTLGDEVGGLELASGAVLLLSTTGPGTYTAPASNWMLLVGASYT